jgi:hypothetical protein
MALCPEKQWAEGGSRDGYASAMLPQPPSREMRKTTALQKRGKITKKARMARMIVTVSVSMAETIA